MGMLDQVLRSALGGRSSGMGMGGSGTSPILMALMALLASRGGGGLGGMLGGGGGNAGGLGGGLGGLGGSLGGLGGLLEMFKQNGHGDAMESWIGKGQNREIAPDQLHEALGPQTVDQLSRETGMPSNDLLRELSAMLPGAVDQLTPEGRVPTPQEQAHW